MNFKSNAKLVVPALVLGLACTACAREERVDVVETEADVVTTTDTTTDTTADMTADMTDETVATETVQETEIAEAEETYEPAPETLPQTAGPLPAIALGGLFSLLAGFGLSLRRRFG